MTDRPENTSAFNVIFPWLSIVIATSVIGVCTLIWALVSWGSPGEGQYLQDPDALQQIGVIKVRELDEASGIDYSVRYPGKLWLHNDSGNAPRLYLVESTGELAGIFQLRSVKNRDWEDLSCFEYQGQSYVLIADVGDNSNRHQEYFVYLIPEANCSLPATNSVQETRIDKQFVQDFVRIPFIYEDGPRDCESVAVDSESGQLLLAQKNFGRRKKDENAGIYQLDLEPWLRNDPARPSQAVAKRIADSPSQNTTGMDISNDNQSLIIRNYLTAHLYRRPQGQDWRQTLNNVQPVVVSMPLERQGEAICFTPDGNCVLVTSEFSRQPIWQIKIEKAIMNK